MAASRDPAYLGLSRDELRGRATAAVAALEDCRLCPRACGVDRLHDAWSACKTGRYAVVSSCFPHFGEEDCLRGWNGSGTVFFGHCNLRCVFCQNFDISQDIKPPFDRLRAARAPVGSTPAQIAAMMLALPVYNTSAYDSLHSIELMNGIVDIYMPDFKYWSADAAGRYLKAADYPDAARAAITAMHEQVGPLVVDEDGLTRRGVLIRHLVMPGGLDETRAILEWIARELGPATYVNLMDQYAPAGRVNGEQYAEINRRLTSAEFRAARQIALALGLRRLDDRRPHPRLRSRLVSG